MKVKKALNLIVLIFIIVYLILGSNIVNAAGGDISATAYDVDVGEKVTVNVSFTAATWDIVVSGKGITEAVYAGYTEDLSEKKTTKSINLNTSQEGSYIITMTGSITDANGVTTKVNKSITVKVSKSEASSTTNNTQTNNTTTTQSKSSEARLSNLGIKPNDFSGFKRDKTEYSTEVPNNVTEVNVYANTVHKGAKVTGTGKLSLKEGNNTAKVTVTAEDGKTTKTYTINIKRKTAEEDKTEAGEARLKTLGIKPEEYDFSGFNSDKTEYNVEIPSDLKEIEVYATAVDSKVQIKGTGKITLQDGDNELKVEVIAENGTKKSYTIKVARIQVEDETEEKIVEKFGLSKLLINGLELNPQFKVDTYEYNVTLKEDINSLEIDTKANEENAIVEIIGNENLQQGENTVTILVTNKETKEVVTYQIVVNKNVTVQEVIQTSWLKPSTWGKEEKIKIAIIIVLIVLILWAIVLKVKMAKENKNNLPGAEELDKAIAEHQELSYDEIEENKIEVPNEETKYENQQNYIQEIAKNKFGFEDEEQEVIKEKPRKKGKGRHF